MDISPEWKRRVQKLFPDLQEGVSLEFTSPVDYNYNCLAWALGCNTKPFENAKGAFWPWRHVPDDTPEGWARICQYHGFEICENGDCVVGIEKVAILQDKEGNLHATRQDRNGKWKSKLGDMGPDIDHVGLGGLKNAYGEIVFFLERRRQDWELPAEAGSPHLSEH